MRQIDVCDSPAAFAIERSDQWVASDRPSMRALTKRLRHLPTVCSCTPISAATALCREHSELSGLGNMPFVRFS